MYKAFAIAGYPAAEVEARFAGMLNAFKYGAPPHGGSAPGIDRIVMLLGGYAEPARDRGLPDEPAGPGSVDAGAGAVAPERLRELHIRLALPPERG